LFQVRHIGFPVSGSSTTGRRALVDREPTVGGDLRRAFRRLLLALGLIVLLALGLLLLWLRLPHVGASLGSEAKEIYGPAHGQLLSHLGHHRPVAGRFSGLARYYPYQRVRAKSQVGAGANTVIRGADRGEPDDGLISSALRYDIGRAEEREPSPENLGTLAVANLVMGEPAKAVQELRQALADQPDEPRLLNDLAVGLLALAATTDDLSLRLDAVEAVEHSLEVRPSLPARFNSALALEMLGLRSRAVAAWRRYLDEDPRSGWGQEAAERLDRLTAESAGWQGEDFLRRPEPDLRALGHNPWADRQLGERTLLGRWAERTLSGDPASADRALADIDAVTAVLSPASGRLLAESAATIREAERTADRQRIDRLARGHAAFIQALRLYRSEHAPEAHGLLAEAVAYLAAAASPFELRARLLRAATSAEPNWAEIDLVARTAADRGLPALAAEAQREAAYRMSLEGRFKPALDAYAEAQRSFTTLGETELAAVLGAMQGELFALVGNESMAMAQLSAALEATPALSDPWNRYSIYVVGASATSRRFRRSAVELRREAAEVCQALPERPLCAIDSMLWIARLTPDAEVGAGALEHAGALLAGVPASAGKERTAIDLAAARARWLSESERSASDSEQAIELYAAAAHSYQALGLVPAAARAHAGRAHVLESLARDGESAAEYREALRVFRVWDQTDRVSTEDGGERLPPELRECYERLLGLELAATAPATSRAAFLLVEEMHDRLAPRRLAHLATAQATDLDSWLASWPPRTAVVEYVLANGKATAWLLSSRHFEQVALTPRPDLTARIRSAIATRNAESWQSGTSALFDELIAPVMARLPAGTARLVVIPDAELYGLPFRALWDATSGRYLDEELTVTLAPSLRQAVALSYREPANSPRPLPVLSLGFREFASNLGLDPLAHAVQEAAAVQAIYGAADIECGGNDWRSFRSCAPRAAVIHLATHAAAGSTSSNTWLAFPRETISLSRLWRELPELTAQPLVVLSSCQSATGGGGEGLGGLVRPFLASGARAVVGTLWRIDDADAAILFTALHRAYRRSGDVAGALREARAALPEWRSRPWAWGGTVAVAGLRIP
jgi:CHAT domain-containing protein